MMKLQDIVLSGRSQAQKDKYHMISLTYGIKKFDLIEAENRTVVTRGWGGKGKDWPICTVRVK
jgi:hypothetical protein